MNDLRKENKRLEAKVHSLSNANHTLQRKLFEYDEMHNRLLTALGFSDLAEAMNSLISESPRLKQTQDQTETIKQLEEALATQLDAVKAAESSIQSISAELHQTRQELSQAMEDIERVRNERYVARKEAEKYATDARTWRMELETKLPEVQSMLRNIKQTYPAGETSTDKDLNARRSSSPNLPGSGLIMEDQYEQLKTQFQALLASKHRLAEKYQQDLLKWKRFKKWVVRGETTHFGTKHKKLTIRQKKRDHEWQYNESANMSCPSNSERGRVMPIFSNHAEESLTQPSEFPSSQTIHGILPSPVSRRKTTTPTPPLLSKNANGTGKTSSTHLADILSVLSKSLLCFDSIHPVIREGGVASAQSCPIASMDEQESKEQTTLASLCGQEFTPSPKEVVSDLIFVPDTLCSKNHATYSSELREKKQEGSNSDSGEVVLINAESSCAKANTSTNINREHINHELPPYTRFKGQGLTVNTEVRHAVSSIASNGGQDGVDKCVRHRNQRKTLKGGDCECCHEYYETIRPLPVSLAPPLWRSPPADTSPKRKRPRQIERRRVEKNDQIEAHKNEISRHRFCSDQATTPPNFWKIGFPDTQEIDDINQRADDMRVRKSQRMNKESKYVGFVLKDLLLT